MPTASTGHNLPKMSENTDLTTTDDQSDNNIAQLSEAPIIENTGDIEVRNFDAVDDDHPLVQYAGQSALQTDANGGGKFISEAIYDHDKAWVREWLQNAETACIRAAKLLIRMSDEYPDGWLTLTKFINDETGETVENPQDVDDKTVALEVPRPIDDVLEAARSLGYDPTIEWEVYLDERQIITTDNGIGMTAREFWEAFESPFSSGSGVDGETGGQFGVGSESVRIVYGDEGGAEIESHSRRPGDHEAFRGYTYSGGATAIPGEVEDGFKGTRFLIPVQDSFNLSNLQSWVEEYVEKLRVPMKYDEYDAGSNPVDEEYEATHFVEDYGEPPVVIERPGEFSVVAGPDVIDTGYHADDNDTFLVSMPIDRNTRASINTFWNVVIQIHDEQGLIVAGPHRGEYREDVGELHEDDVPLPEPTGDRDRLTRDADSKRFFHYVQDVVESEELAEVADIAERMEKAPHPADAIRGEESDWTLFKKMVNYHGSRRVAEKERKFRKFVNDRDEFPDYDDETVKQMFGLFKEVQHCTRGAAYSTKKSNRTAKPLGNIIAQGGSTEVYMAASTGGNFVDYFKVAENTHDDVEVIVISGSRKYESWSNLFGFKVLNEVPLTNETDDEPHDYDVPDSIHEDNINKGTTNTGKADEVLNRALKLRTDDDNSSIDLRLSIEDAQERLENGQKFGGHSKMVLFTSSRDTENISDHYDFSKYAAIASVSKTEYEALADYDEVMTFEEYTEWSKSALIATEDGAMTPSEIIEDDRMVVLAFRPTHDHDVVKLLGDDFEQLRTYYAEDVRDQVSWTKKLDNYDGGYSGDDESEVDDDEKDDTLFAVADPIVLQRAEWAFDNLWAEEGYFERDLSCLKLARQKYKYGTPADWRTLDKSTKRYRLMADTPKWDDSSDVYELFPRKRDSWKGQVLLGFHDRGIDPSEKDNDTLRDLIGGGN